MELESIASADILTAPSHYMIKWLRSNDFTLPPPERTHVIQNISRHIARLLNDSKAPSHAGRCNEIVLFGRHEDRKGVIPFCDALDIANEILAEAGVLVTFLGP